MFLEGALEFQVKTTNPRIFGENRPQNADSSSILPAGWITAPRNPPASRSRDSKERRSWSGRTSGTGHWQKNKISCGRPRAPCFVSGAGRCRSALFPNFFELPRRVPSRGRGLFARPFHSAGAPFFPPPRIGEPAIVIAHTELETTARANLVRAATGLRARCLLEFRVAADRALVIHLISTF